MKLAELLNVLPFYKWNSELNDIDVANVETDSRRVTSGTLFICIKGFTVDGHDFVSQAIKKGACAIIAQRQLNVDVPVIIVNDTSSALSKVSAAFFGNPTQKLALTGVTGTNGKTTVTYLLESIFKRHHLTTGVIGTIQMKIGEKSSPVKNTTPDALLLQRTFKQMCDANVDHAVMEVSSHALDMGRVHGCDFDIAVFTNLSQDHLDYHDNMDDYLRAKSLLFSQLGNAYTNRRKYAVLNADDSSYAVLKKSTAQHIITYGCKNDAQVKADNINLGIAKTMFTMHTPLGTVDINSRLIGMFNVYNMLAAASAAIAAGVPLQTIKEALSNMKGVRGRFEPVDGNQSFATIVDYAHTPDSLENVLQTITGFAKKKVYVVVGCGGDRDKTKRPLMAAIALKYADQAIFTSDNPRTEDPAAILTDMTNGLTGDHYEVIEGRKDAIYHAVNLAAEGDIILIAGKGHETYQEIGNTRYDFDDREVAEKAIRSKGE